MKIKIITHFYVEDKDCSGDYASREVLVDGEQVLSLSDAYHSIGESAGSFVKGFNTALLRSGSITKPIVAEKVDVADDDSAC